MRELAVEIEAGTLHLTLRSERLPIEDLLTFATRENSKRAFLFVSKVLGRHWPCRPSVMRRTYGLLAEVLVDLPGPILFVGMAETATALGHGVFDSFLRSSSRNDAFYMHTTRHSLPRPVAVSTEEPHSHAAEHTIYEPDPAYEVLFHEARTLVLVDDEISTGTTLLALANALIARCPRIEQVWLVSLVSWLSDPTALAQKLDRPVCFHSLASGAFELTARPGFVPRDPTGNTRAIRVGRWVNPSFGRTGFSGLLEIPRIPELPTRSRLMVIGSGEFAFAPFRLAEVLEEAGHDVLFQSTTRSPIQLGDAIHSRLSFEDHHDEGVANYLYNFVEDDRRTIIGYEHPEIARSHSLVARLGASAWTPFDSETEP